MKNKINPAIRELKVRKKKEGGYTSSSTNASIIAVLEALTETSE